MLQKTHACCYPNSNNYVILTSWYLRFWMDIIFWLFNSPPRCSGWYCTECYLIRSLMEPSRQRATRRKLKILSQAWVKLESNASLFSCITSVFCDSCLICAHTTSMCLKLSDIPQCFHNGCARRYEEHLHYCIHATMCVVSSDVSSISDVCKYMISVMYMCLP